MATPDLVRQHQTTLNRKTVLYFLVTIERLKNKDEVHSSDDMPRMGLERRNVDKDDWVTKT